MKRLGGGDAEAATCCLLRARNIAVRSVVRCWKGDVPYSEYLLGVLVASRQQLCSELIVLNTSEKGLLPRRID
uniref:Uncharacterized protein n=1 Tax=Oryza punctata TaxID=4537 RepID=A0A0E0JRR5_ORYPU